MTTLRGRLTTLRPIRRDDLKLLHRWLNDPSIMQYWDGRDHPATFDRVETRFRKSVEGLDRDAVRMMIEIPKSEGSEGAGEMRTIGMVQHGRIVPRAKNTQVDMLIGEADCRDAGYGTDAMRAFLGHLFGAMKIHRVWLTLRDSNAGATRGAEKCGFVREGVLREHDFLEGKHVDVVVYGILARDWASAPPPSE
jgi:RimJ/RimL family protein N-acetyltransferase